jgi:hypothetical protein
VESAQGLDEVFVTMRSDHDNFVNIAVMQLSSTVASVGFNTKQGCRATQ